MQRLINRALSGDGSTLDLLDVVDEEEVPAVRAITPQTLQSDYKYACRQYLAALHLQVRGMERLAKKYLLKLPYLPVYNAHFFSLKLTFKFPMRYTRIASQLITVISIRKDKRNTNTKTLQ